jgi:DNA modification methylase
MVEGFNFVGIDKEPDYFAIASARIRHETRQPTLFA